METLRKIGQFVDGGGLVISWQVIPRNRSDRSNSGEFQALVQKIWENRNGRVIHAATEAELRSVLKKAGAPELVITPDTEEVYCQHRLLPQGDIFFLLNNAQQPVSGGFALRAQGQAELWDPASGGISPLMTTRTSTETATISLAIPAQRHMCENPASAYNFFWFSSLRSTSGSTGLMRW